MLILVAAAAMFAACNHSSQEPTRDQLAATIDSIESAIATAVQVESIDTTEGNNIITLYLEFADTYPTDSLAPFCLHHAAQVANGLDRIDDMVTYYNRVIDNYPDYAKLDECYYEKGIALDNADRKDEARKAYQEFLEKYPDHFLTDDIRGAISLLDFSDEMLIEYFKQKNADQ